MTTEKLRVLEKTGKFQYFVLIVFAIPAFVASSMALLFSWTGYSPNVRCRIPGVDPPMSTNYSLPAPYNATSMDWFYAPPNEIGQYCSYCPSNISGAMDTCTRDREIKCNNGYILDMADSEIHDTLVQKFSMYCDDVYKKNIIWTLTTFGIFCSAPLWALISDRFGRRAAALMSAASGIVIYFTYALQDNFITYCIYTFVANGCSYGTYMTTYVILMESLNDKARTWLGPLMQNFGTFAELYVGLIAFLCRRWRLIHLVVAAPSILLLSYYWVCPESILWLLATGKTDKARQAVKFACRLNNMPEETVDYTQHSRDRSLSAAAPTTTTVTRRRSSVLSVHFTHVTVFDMFKNWRSTYVTLIVWFKWFAIIMCYFGLAQNTADLPGDPFQAWTYSALAEIPGSFMAVLTMQYLGRKPATVISFVVAGVCCIVSGVVSNSTAKLTMALVGRMWCLGGTLIVYNYTMELFPTVIRQTTTTIGSVCGRFGAMLAPTIRYALGPEISKSFPIITYGSVCALAGILCIMLPETKGKLPPETVEDALVLYGAPKIRDRPPSYDSIAMTTTSKTK